jgi:hypothetical protein
MLFMRCLAEPRAVHMALAEQPHVLKVREEAGDFVVEFEGSEDDIANLLAELVQRDLRPIEFRWHRIDLEELFLSFTEGRLQ